MYKRRISLPEEEAMDWICGRRHCASDFQIVKEIDYFCNYYGSLRPKVYLSYKREAYYSRTGGDFRVTFDDNILCKVDDASLSTESGKIPLLEEGTVLMEIKCSGGIPLWMVKVLSEEKIYKTSFSKYGSA